MKYTNIFTTISFLALSLPYSASFASSSNNNLETTAKIVTSCTINVENVNFGILPAPLVAQSANSQMHVLCNNNASYKVDLAYGGIYGQGAAPSGYSFKYYGSGNLYYLVTPTNTNLGYINCSTDGKIAYSNLAVANYFGSNNVSVWVPDSKHTCTTNGTIAGTYPTGWTGAYNATGTQPIAGSAYAYGIMSGSINKNSVAYSISIPNDSSKVWNAGNNSYSATGTGLLQNISVNAKIVPDKSSSLFPAQDFYLDTVSAVITF